MTPAECEAIARRELAKVYTPEGVEQWLTGRKRWPDARCPLDQIYDGRGDEVLARIAQLVDGAFA